jgi:hypothetical protein
VAFMLGDLDREVKRPVEPLRGRRVNLLGETWPDPEAVRRLAHDAALRYDAQHAGDDRFPLERTARYLLEQLPALATLDEAREVVEHTLRRAAERCELSYVEHLLVEVWHSYVVERRESARAERLRGGYRG